MPKIGRAGPGDSSKGGRKGARRKTQQASRKGSNRVMNWAAAQVRAARLRMAYAARLVMIALAVIAGGILAVYVAVGRLDEAGAALMASFENRLTRAGYTVQWVDVSGADRLSAEEIARIIGIAPGAGMAELDLAAARAALEAQPWVGRAEIIRLWPDRIVVRVDEREPFALWQLDGGHRVIDRTGVVIEAADPIDFAHLPRVTGQGADREASVIVTLLEVYPEVRTRTTHALYVGERRWSLRLQSGGEVLLPADNPGGALAMLSAMHQARGVLDYDAQILDLRNEGEMVMRPWPDRVAEAAGRGA